MRNGWVNNGVRPEYSWFPRWFSDSKACSAYCCGNPRKHFKEKTIQEYKSEDDMVLQINTLDGYKYIDDYLIEELYLHLNKKGAIL